jgi:hypothetical protein
MRDGERHSGMSASSGEAVWNGGMRDVPAGKEVSASYVTAAKFYACALVSAQVSTTKST